MLKQDIHRTRSCGNLRGSNNSSANALPPEQQLVHVYPSRDSTPYTLEPGTWNQAHVGLDKRTVDRPVDHLGNLSRSNLRRSQSCERVSASSLCTAPVTLRRLRHRSIHPAAPGSNRNCRCLERRPRRGFHLHLRPRRLSSGIRHRSDHLDGPVRNEDRPPSHALPLETV